MSKIYRSSCSQGENMLYGLAFECYFCRKFFLRVDRQNQHDENCSGIPRIVYNFSFENLVAFDDNLKCKGDLPMIIYFYYEATAPTDNFFNPEQKKEKRLLCHML